MAMRVPNDPLPSFGGWRDRAAFLAAEYRIPISVTIFSAFLWLTFNEIEYSPPDGTMAVLGSFMLLSFPGFFVGKKIVDWLYDPNMVQVAVVLPGHDIVYRCIEVPPGIWEDKEVHGASPLPVDQGWADYLVTEYEYLEDIDELVIRGCELSMLEPGEAVANAEKIEEYYRDYLQVRDSYAKLRARVASLAQDAHDDGLLAALDVEDKTLAPGVSVLDLLDKAEDGDDDELPTIDDLQEPVGETDLNGEKTNGEPDPEDATDFEWVGEPKYE